MSVPVRRELRPTFPHEAGGHRYKNQSSQLRRKLGPCYWKHGEPRSAKCFWERPEEERKAQQDRSQGEAPASPGAITHQILIAETEHI